jgi:hypothetical protein
LTEDSSAGFMLPFHSTSKVDFCVLKTHCVLKIFSKPRRVKNSPATGVKHLYVPAPKMSPDVYTFVTPCSRVRISQLKRVCAAYERTHTIFILKKWNSVCICTLQYVRCSTTYLYPPQHVLTCGGVHHARQ